MNISDAVSLVNFFGEDKIRGTLSDVVVTIKGHRLDGGWALELARSLRDNSSISASVLVNLIVTYSGNAEDFFTNQEIHKLSKVILISLLPESIQFEPDWKDLAFWMTESKTWSYNEILGSIKDNNMNMRDFLFLLEGRTEEEVKSFLDIFLS